MWNEPVGVGVTGFWDRRCPDANLVFSTVILKVHMTDLRKALWKARRSESSDDQSKG
ncbi:MAG: hypothetical protein J0L72_04000 [Armatimonadetes bacterium]|nr:hypothetical protein [Armatimonadota bacterium]